MTNFSIDADVLNDFNIVAKKTALNKSQFVENAMRDYTLRYFTMKAGETMANNDENKKSNNV